MLWSTHGHPLPRTVAAISLFDGGLNVAAGLAMQGICARMRRDTACLDCFYRYFKHQFDQQPTGFTPMDGHGMDH